MLWINVQKKVKLVFEARSEPQQVEHFLTDFNLVYTTEKAFTSGLRICKLIVDVWIFGYIICERAIENVLKKLKSVFEATFWTSPSSPLFNRF